MNCPAVLFVIFNRPDLTQRVFARIREACPTQLFVAADGPRADRPEDVALCAAARAVVGQVDWECEVQTLFPDHNLGCKRAVSSAITWFFEQLDEGIILEDDCLPDPTFFRFCAELLEKYRRDERVMMISGDNFQGRDRAQPNGYYFSVYTHVWGWATWRRAWRKYDGDLSDWPKLADTRWLDEVLSDMEAVKYWASIFEVAHSRKVDTWDYPWTYSCWVQKGLTILPGVNLVSNIGFDYRATHTKDASSKVANLHAAAIRFPLRQPPIVAPNRAADRLTFERHYSTAQPQRTNGPYQASRTHGATSAHLRLLTSPSNIAQMTRLAQAVVPPVVYRAIRAMCRPRPNQKPQVSQVPDWHFITGGPLAGHPIFAQLGMPAFEQMIKGEYDCFFWKYLADVSLESGTVFDVGGHIGYHSLCFAKLTGRRGRVHVFEPNEFNVKRMKLILSRNKELAETITVNQVAVADVYGNEVFNSSANIEDQTSLGGYLEGSYKPLSDEVYRNSNFVSGNVSVVTLDGYVESKEVESVKLIKIDVEGAEHRVLQGAQATIGRFRPILLIEVHSTSAMPHVCKDLFSMNYEITVLHEDYSSRCFLGARWRCLQLH
jgi:FkbM family methyltransferase